MTDSTVTFADVCATVRAVLGLAQEDLAARVGVSRKSVQRWERGLALPDARVEVEFAALCARERLFARAPDPLWRYGIGSWEDIAAVLSSSRAHKAAGITAGRVGEELIGRDADRATVRALLDAGRLVTITGPGGVGKTSLATAIAFTVQGPMVFVELAAVRSADLVLGAIAAQLGLAFDPELSLRTQVIEAIARRGLIVLDNLEHLPAAAPLVADLVGSTPGIRVLVTSRAPLGLPNELVHVLDPLRADDAASDAARLFVRTAHRLGTDVDRAAATQEQVVEICRRLDGLPLAIELVAARLRVVSLDDVLARLHSPLYLAAGGSTARPDRHRSLRASLDWSAALLTPTARDLLGELAAFVGGWHLTAVEHLDPLTGLDALAELVDAGLVRRGGSRYRMAEPVREYASELDPTRGAAFVAWVCDAATRIDAGARSAGADELLAEFDAEYLNFQAALGHCLEHGDGDAAHRLCLALTAGWDARSKLRDARHWIERTLATSTGPFSAAALHNWLAYFAALQGDFDNARRHAHAALTTWEQHGVDAGIGYACLILGRVAAETDALDEARALLLRSEATLRAAGDDWGLVRPVNALGELAREQGDLDTARTRHLQAATMCRRLGDEGSLPSILADLANVAADRGDGPTAATYAEEALAIATRRSNPVGVAAALDALGRGHHRCGDTATAIACWAEADAIRTEINHPVERRDRQRLANDRDAAGGTGP